mgnify:CR=1 FL=1
MLYPDFVDITAACSRIQFFARQQSIYHDFDPPPSLEFGVV